MLSRIRPRLTYANVMSSIALFVVLGGGAYATIDRKIGPKDIRKNAVKKKQLGPRAVNPVHINRGAVRPPKVATNAIRPRHLMDGAVLTDTLGDGAVTGAKIGALAVGTGNIANNAVTGAKVNESTLGTVPSADTAAMADTATEALSARVANGVRPVKVDFARPADTPDTVLLEEGGIRILGRCSPEGAPVITFRSTAANGVLTSHTVRADGTVTPGHFLSFDPPATLALSVTPPGLFTSSLVFRGGDGTTVSGDLLVAAGSGAAPCVIAGTLFVA